MKKRILSILFALLMIFSLKATALATKEHGEILAATTENSIEFVSIDEVSWDHITYTVEVHTTAEFALAGYGIGIEYSTVSGFSGYSYTSMDWSGTYDYHDTDLTTTRTRYSVNLVPGTHYWIRPLLIGYGNSTSFSGDPADAWGETWEFDGPSNGNSYTTMSLNQYVNVKQFNIQWLHAKFTAPESGLYALAGYDDAFQFISYFTSDWSGWGTTGEAQNNHSNPLSIEFYLSQGETVYLFAHVKNSYTGSSANARIVPADDVLTRLQVNEPYSGNQVCIFEAPSAGWYSFRFEDEDTRCYMNTLDVQSGSLTNWGNSYTHYFEAGETVYIQPQVNVSQIGMHRTVVQRTTPAQNSIEVGDSFNVTNLRAMFPFTVSIAEETANSGYQVGIIYGAHGSNPEEWTEIVKFYMPEYVVMVSNYRTYGNRGAFVPGMDVDYQAAIFDAGTDEILARGSYVGRLETPDTMDDMVKLTENSTPYTWNDRGMIPFYFIAPADGMYAVQGTGMDSLRLTDKTNEVLGFGRNEASYLLCRYLKAGEIIYVMTYNNGANNCSIAVTAGLTTLDTIGIGNKTLDSVAPVCFRAPAGAIYRFSLSDMRRNLLMVDSDGDWATMGSSFEIALGEGQRLWLRRDDGIECTLTVEEAGELSTLTLPAELTSLDMEAFRDMTAQRVVFGAEIERINSLAFADCPHLIQVEIPVASVTIADNAFENCSDIVLVAPTSGTLEAYAANHSNINFSRMED